MTSGDPRSEPSVEHRRAISASSYRDAVARLVLVHDAMVADGIEASVERKWVVIYMAGWCAQSARLTRAYLLLRKHEFENEASGIVRQILENALVCHHVSVTGHSAVQGMAANHQRSLINLKRDSTGGPVEFPAALDPIIESELENPAARWPDIQTICQDLGLTETVYVMYRILSPFAHASENSSSQFIEFSEDDVLGPRKYPAKAHEWIGVVAHALVWTLTSLDRCLLGQGYRTQLEEIAAQIDCRPDLPLRTAAVERPPPPTPDEAEGDPGRLPGLGSPARTDANRESAE